MNLIRMTKISTTVWLGLCFAMLGVGMWIGAHVQTTKASTEAKAGSSEIRQSGVRGGYTNPLLECRELPQTVSIGERIALQEKVSSMLEEWKSAGKITDGAVYFRDLNNGPWFGVNEDKKFTPASLLKIPLAVSYYWRAEDEPEILQSTILYQKTADNFEANQPYGPTHALENNTTYTIEELITLMLQESSNEAALALSQIAGVEQIQKVYRDFGQAEPSLGADFIIDVRTYASFFRTLFNATYLDRRDSEKILGLLAQSTFREGIVAGVPADVAVAHKFGTREFNGQAATRQLHDCGIVYAGEIPYLLCIMTQGRDFSVLAEFIKEVSAVVYKNVSLKE